MQIAVAQLECIPGDVAGNVAKMLDVIDRASGSDAVLFPEMCDTGYVMPVILKTASAWNEGPLPALQNAAAKRGVHVIAGLSERTPEGIFNSVAVIGPDGNLKAKYRKIHLATVEPIREHEYLLAGDAPVLVEIAGWRVGLMICYDIRFPELARTLAVDGAEALLVSSAWPEVRINHWTAINTCRAIENQCWLAAANRCGTDDGLTMGGRSLIVNPMGEAVQSGGPGEELLIAKFEKPLMQAIRQKVPVFRDRRPAVYRL